MAIRHTTNTPFDLRSRRAKKREYMSMRNRVLRSAPVLGGKFTTHDYMHGQNSWIDLHFLGRKAPIVYCVALQTTIFEFKELVSERAWEKSYELAPEHEHELAQREPCRFAELNGQTRLDWSMGQCQAITNSGEVQVFERWTLHRNYHRGIGLHATIDVPYLTIDAVNAFIDRFLKEEANFRDPTARTYRYDQIAHWGIEANAVIEPWQWEAALQRQAVEDEQISHEESGKSKDLSQ